MHLTIRHTTRYHFATPVDYGLQQLRLTPKSREVQEVRRWATRIEGGEVQLEFEDCHKNTVTLVSLDRGTTEVTVHCEGEVETADTLGVVGDHMGFVPMWMFRRQTDLTRPGSGVRALVAELDDTALPLDRLHALSALILKMVSYETGRTDVGHAAEDVLSAGHGVCQDHAHVFLAAARLLGHPARYVSGYLYMDDRVDQDAGHAWAEAHVANLGWVGFDVSNGISPDARYVRVATGLDYRGAAPISGVRYGAGDERLSVAVQVAEQ